MGVWGTGIFFGPGTKYRESKQECSKVAPPPLQGRIIFCFGLCFQGVGQVQKGWGSLSSWGGWGGSLDRLARIFLCWGGLPWVTITAISLLWHWLSLPNACPVPGTLGISQPFLRSITAISQKWYFQNRIAKEMPLEREGRTWPGTPFGHRQIWDLNSVLIDFQVSAILVECLSFFWSRGLALQRVGHFTHLAMTPVRINSVPTTLVTSPPGWVAPLFHFHSLDVPLTFGHHQLNLRSQTQSHFKLKIYLNQRIRFCQLKTQMYLLTISYRYTTYHGHFHLHYPLLFSSTPSKLNEKWNKRRRTWLILKHGEDFFNSGCKGESWQREESSWTWEKRGRENKRGVTNKRGSPC